MYVRIFGLVEGLMVCWDEVEEAAQYHVHLFIGNHHKHYESINGSRRLVDGEQTFKEIALVDVDRNYKYHSFTGLSRIHLEYEYSPIYGRSVRDTGLNYYVEVEAEDRTGAIVDKSERCSGLVLELTDAGDR